MALLKHTRQRVRYHCLLFTALYGSPLKLISTFAASSHSIRDLHLFRDADEGEVAPLLASCPVMRVDEGETVSDP